MENAERQRAVRWRGALVLFGRSVYLISAVALVGILARDAIRFFALDVRIDSLHWITRYIWRLALSLLVGASPESHNSSVDADDDAIFLPVSKYVASVLEEIHKASDEGHACSSAREICERTALEPAVLARCIQRICEAHSFRTCKTQAVQQCESALHHNYDLQIFEKCAEGDTACINALVAECSARVMDACYPSLFAGACAQEMLRETARQIHG